jgi:hypothetical protein
MPTLDLHGVSHAAADRLVENFVLLNDGPVRVITGNSLAMQTIVKCVAARYDLHSEPETYWNLGSLIVR